MRGKFYLETKDEPPFGENASNAHYTIESNVTTTVTPSVAIPDAARFLDIFTLTATAAKRGREQNLQHPAEWRPNEGHHLRKAPQETLIKLYYSIDYGEGADEISRFTSSASFL